jgi:hypothetical protein
LAQIFAVMISAGPDQRHQQMLDGSVFAFANQCRPVKTMVNIVMLLITAIIPRNHSE